MSGTFTNLLYYVVFSTKHREPIIHRTLQSELYKYMSGIVRNHGGVLLEIGGMPDHVHCIAKFKPDVSVSKMVGLIKSNSSKWANERSEKQGRFSWQVGFGAFSVSESQLAHVRQYVFGQEEHHRQMSFQEEYLKLLKRHDIEYDERYLWD